MSKYISKYGARCTFNGLEVLNLSTEELTKLWKMKRKNKKLDTYKIVITTDRCDYDNLTELVEYPERGKRIGTFYFYNPNQLDLILKAFEGHFYQTFDSNGIRKGYGVVDDLVYEDWWDDECCCVCEGCFLRRSNGTGNYECKRGDA